MGILGGKKSAEPDNRIVQAAREALDAGRTVFIERYTGGLTYLISPTDALGQTVEAVERMGWRLDKWEVTDVPTSGLNDVRIWFLFRRS